MSIRPVDFQVAIPRSMEASKVTGNEANKNLAMQQQVLDSVQHKTENSLNQVYSRSKPEEAGIREKQKENKNKGKDGSEKNEDKNHDHEGKAQHKNSMRKDVQTSIIDIKI